MNSLSLGDLAVIAGKQCALEAATVCINTLHLRGREKEKRLDGLCEAELPG